MVEGSPLVRSAFQAAMMFFLILASCFLFAPMIRGCMKAVIVFVFIGYVFHRYPEIQRDFWDLVDTAQRKITEFTNER
jgi:hypothetical protein